LLSASGHARLNQESHRWIEAEIMAWLDAVEADDLPALHSFAAGIRRDLDAVTNGLTLEHSSGAVEGGVGRLKMLKRQTSGRANFDLLRARVLLTT
jgi:transposase